MRRREESSHFHRSECKFPPPLNGKNNFILYVYVCVFSSFQSPVGFTIVIKKDEPISLWHIYLFPSPREHLHMYAYRGDKRVRDFGHDISIERLRRRGVNIYDRLWWEIPISQRKRKKRKSCMEMKCQHKSTASRQQSSAIQNGVTKFVLRLSLSLSV